MLDLYKTLASSHKVLGAVLIVTVGRMRVKWRKCRMESQNVAEHVMSYKDNWIGWDCFPWSQGDPV